MARKATAATPTGNGLPEPIFELKFSNTECDVAVDERSSIFRLTVSATGIDWERYTLERVQVCFNAASLPNHVLVNGCARPDETGVVFTTTPSAWYPLTPEFSIGNDKPRSSKVVVKTGLFAAIEIAANSRKKGLQLGPESLADHPSAEAGPVMLETRVHCLVRPVDGFKPEMYSARPLEFAIAKD